MKRILKAGHQTWVHFQGRTFVIEENAKAARKSSSSSATHGIIESPMPGKVLQIKCQAGDKVEENQTVAVIEAMKMEHSLKAPFTGIVKEVLKKAGDQINLGDKILEITP